MEIWQDGKLKREEIARIGPHEGRSCPIYEHTQEAYATAILYLAGDKPLAPGIGKTGEDEESIAANGSTISTFVQDFGDANATAVALYQTAMTAWLSTVQMLESLYMPKEFGAPLSASIASQRGSVGGQMPKGGGSAPAQPPQAHKPEPPDDRPATEKLWEQPVPHLPPHAAPVPAQQGAAPAAAPKKKPIKKPKEA